GPAPALLVAGFGVPDEQLSTFDTWYRDQAGPALAADPGCLGARLVEVAESNTGWNRMAVLRLSDDPVPAAVGELAGGAGTGWCAVATYHVTATATFAG